MRTFTGKKHTFHFESNGKILITNAKIDENGYAMIDYNDFYDFARYTVASEMISTLEDKFM